jgi:hypothetical protein
LVKVSSTTAAGYPNMIGSMSWPDQTTIGSAASAINVFRF